MSSFKKSSKAHGHLHRERCQPSHRRHLGMLEKKKDYKLRADDHQKKAFALKKLQQKALSRNPDEFYFKMINTNLQDGVHQCEENIAPAYTEEQLRLMTTQDIKYIRFKRQMELKKVEKLRSVLHSIDVHLDKPNSHKIYVDTPFEAQNYDLAKHFGVPHDFEDSDLCPKNRSNRLCYLPHIIVRDRVDGNEGSSHSASRKAYRELSARLKRLEQLSIVLAKMETKQRLMKKDSSADSRVERSSRPRLVVPETPDAAPVYRWPKRRQK